MLSRNINSKARQVGFALQDVMLAIGLFLIVGLIAYGLFGTGSDNAGLATERANITHVRQQIQSCYAPFGGDYTDLNNADAISCGAFTESMLRGSNTPTNAFQGDVTVEVDANVRQFTITEESVPGPDVCIKLAGFMNGQWVNVTVNGTAVPQDGGPAAAEAARTGCNDNDNNTIIYTSG